MKPLLDFDDAGASDDEPVKGVTVGDIRAWHDQYDKILTTWAECRSRLREAESEISVINPMDNLLIRVAKAICKSRTCEGISCCQWPAQAGRPDCPVKRGSYDDAAMAAVEAVCDDMRQGGME